MDTKKPMTVDDEIAYNNYKLTADKILQLLSQIREDPSASAKRWVWEFCKMQKMFLIVLEKYLLRLS